MTQLSLVAVALMLGAMPLAAQSLGLAPESGSPWWLREWSPLAARADLPRRLPHVDAVPAALLLPAPRVGLFWTAGNPAGFRDELEDTRSDFTLAAAQESGSFRRPLDPGERSVRQASGSGWAPLQERFALLGRVELDQERFDPGATADVLEAYPTSPFVTLDTSSTATRRTRARLEGVGGLRLGGWGLGLALGYESREHRTIEAGFVRLTRTAIPGAVLGVSRSTGSIRVGAYGRWRQRAETILLVERAAHGLVIELEGLRNVSPLEILAEYYRRIEETTPSAGLTTAGRLGAGRWALFAEREWLREGLTRQEQDDPAEDRWEADGWAAGGAYQRPMGGQRLFTLQARYTTINGTGDVALDSVGVIFEATERSLAGRAELRIEPGEEGWGAVFGGQIRYERRVRDALTVPIAARITALTTGGSVEIARAFSPKVLVTGTVALASYSANSSFPARNTLGPVYRTYILGEHDLAARKAIPWLGALGVRWQASTKASVWTLLRAERLAPTKDVGPTGVGPTGSRRAVSAVVGVTLQ